MKMAVGYVRVSTTEQANEGVSLAAQQKKIAAWSALNDVNVVQVFSETGSGKDMKHRPEVNKAIEFACQHKATLVCYSLSRLARSTRDFLKIVERLKDCGATLALLNENIDCSSSMGTVVLTVLAALAQFEREQIADRTRDAFKYLRQQNVRISYKVPFGYKRKGPKLIPIQAEQDAIDLMKRLSAKKYSLRGICKALEKRGIKTKNNQSCWRPSAVHGILARQRKVS